MKEFWNNRYGDAAFAYGHEPNEFFKESLKRYNLNGKILLPGEGEGRNAVYAAKSGLDVTAFDLSEEGKNKALKLAEDNEVKINYMVGDFSEFQFEENFFDVIALIFAHFPAELKSQYHKRLAQLLKPGGLIIFEAFSKTHLEFSMENPSAGGPKNIDMLFSTEEVKDDFPGFEILELEEKEVELNEGIYHQGKSSVIRFVGRKK